MVSAPVRKIIHSLKLVDYLLAQADKPWYNYYCILGWSGAAMVLGKLPVPGRTTIWMIVGQRPNALAVGAGGGCLDMFTLFYLFSPLSPSLWETALYRLKYCLKGPLNPKQSTNNLLFSHVRSYTVCD